VAVGASRPSYPSMITNPASANPSPEGVKGTMVSSEAVSATTKAPATETEALTVASTRYRELSCTQFTASLSMPRGTPWGAPPDTLPEASLPEEFSALTGYHTYSYLLDALALLTFAAVALGISTRRFEREG
jgi:hypothetical protein